MVGDVYPDGVYVVCFTGCHLFPEFLGEGIGAKEVFFPVAEGDESSQVVSLFAEVFLDGVDYFLGNFPEVEGGCDVVCDFLEGDDVLVLFFEFFVV